MYKILTHCPNWSTWTEPSLFGYGVLDKVLLLTGLIQVDATGKSGWSKHCHPWQCSTASQVYRSLLFY